METSNCCKFIIISKSAMVSLIWVGIGRKDMETSFFRQPKNPTKLLTALVAAALICGGLSAPSISAEPPVYQGYSLAVPINSQTPATEISMPFIRNETLYKIIVSVSENGETESLSFSQRLNPPIKNYLSSIISQIEYEPAVYLGSKRSCQLPLIIMANPRFRNSVIFFPVSSDFEVSDNLLYYEALRLNKFELPELLSFPQYFCTLKRSDSLKILPYVLEKLSLDSAGNVIKSENFSASIKAEAYSTQIQAASLWAEFSPLKVEGLSRPSDCYLLISFLPQLHYPTKIIAVSESDNSHWADRWRVLLLPDTAGIMVPPLPLELNISTITIRKKQHRYLTGEILATISIDSLGEARVIMIDRKDTEFRQAINSVVSSVGFFPAMSFHGRPQKFTGKARFHFTYSATVRVEYLWLNFQN